MEPDALEVHLVELNPAHNEGVIELHNAIYPDYRTTLEELRFEDETWDHSKYFFKRWFSLKPRDRAIGYGEASYSIMFFHPRMFRVHVDVHPE